MHHEVTCNSLLFTLLSASALALAFAAPSEVSAQPYINEIFFDPPGSGDDTQEYIELRGTPGMSLNNHYLIFLENENTPQGTGNPGQIEMIFNLAGRSFSPAGFFSLRQKNNPYSNVATNEFNVVNTLGVNRWGTTPGVDNDIGVSSSILYSDTPGRIENSGFTAMLIHVNSGGPAPTLGMKLDGAVDNDNDPLTTHDGLDYPNGVPDLSGGLPAWSILDSVGIFSEATIPGGSVGEAFFGRTYAKINFGPEIPGREYTFLVNGVPTTRVFQPNIGDGQTYVGLDFEVEHIARWGNSTGQTAADWHITNVTDNVNAGFAGAADGFRQSGNYHDPPLGANDFVETNQFVPYGANLTNTLGAANYPLNLTQFPWDYNQNGEVDAADYIVWRKTLGSTTDLRADGNNGKSVEEDDYRWWVGRFGGQLGQSGSAALGTSPAVPEPPSTLLAVASLCVLIAYSSRSAR